MEFLFAGSVSQYVKGLTRQTQWQLKKESGDLTSHKTSLRDYVSFTKASDLLPDADERDDKLSAIVTKAQFGKKLSRGDWEYLKAKAPELYAKFREIEREQEGYEEALRRCKTRDEALRLHVSKLGEIMTAVKNGDSSALFRLNRLTQTMTAFTESEEYHKLPTESEQAIEREMERKEKLEALRQEAEAREAEREAAEESRAEGEERAEDVSEAMDDPEAEPIPKAEDGAKRRAGPEVGDAATIPPRATGGSESTAHAPDVRRAVSQAAGRAAPRQSKAEAETLSAEHHAAPAMSLGQRAYRNQQNIESDDTYRRRKAFDAEA